MKKPASYSKYLREAAAIADQREPQYGTALSNLDDTADILYAMYGIECTAVELAQIMVAFKTSREKNLHKKDNIIDTINYNAILLLAKEREKNRTQ